MAQTKPTNNNWFSNLLPAIENIVNQNVVKPAQQALPQIMASPMSQALQGNNQGVVNSLNEMVTKGTLAGKPYSPQVQVAADTGATGLTTGKLPKIAPKDQPTDMGSYSFSDRNAPVAKEKGVYKNPVLKPKPNGGKAVRSQKAEDLPSGYTADELAQQRANPAQQTEQPQIVGQSNPQRTHNPSINIGDNVKASQLRNIQIDGKNVKTPNEANQVNATLNGYGIKGSLTQQLQASQDKIGNLSKQAEAIVTKQGGTISKSQLTANMSHEISQTEGHGLDPQTVPYQVGSYIDRVYARAVGKDPLTTIAPPDIPGSVVQKMKTFMNADSKTTFGKDPTTWSPGQVISRNSRDAFDNVLDNYYPNASKLNNDMSDLYKSYDSLKTGANQEGAAAQKTANTPSAWQRFRSQSPFAQAAEVGAGIGGLTYAGNKALPVIGAAVGLARPVADTIANTLGYTPKNSAEGPENQKQPTNTGSTIQDNHNGGIIDQSFTKVKPNPDGTYSLPQSAPQGQNQRHYMSSQEYQDKLAQIGQQYTYGTPGYNNEKTKLDAQHNLDQQQADEVFKGNNVKNFMDNATTYNADGNQLAGSLLSLPTSFWNGVSKAGSIRAYQDPKYASQLQQIDSFNNEFASAYESVTGKKPTDNQLLSSANSIKQATTKYISMMQFISGTYGKYVSPYLALTSGTGTQSTYGTPIGTTSKNLPPVTNPVPAGMLNTPASIPGADAGLPAIQ